MNNIKKKAPNRARRDEKKDSNAHREKFEDTKKYSC